MTAKNRAALIGKLHTALKKHFKPAPPSPGRPLMEHVLYASLLEDSPADLADEGFAKCEQEYFDWNEVRVTTVTELAEVLNRLPNAQSAAMRLKRNLQSIFETFYNFDIDFLKKENLGKAVAKFESMTGMSHFVLGYIVQHGLGGHAIPIDKSSMKLMWLCGIVSDAESDSGKVPGIERTIPKNKSIEFSSLLHQAAIAFQANNKDKAVWDVLLAVNKDAKALFDRPAPQKPKSEKRSAAKALAAEAASAAAAVAAAKSGAKQDGKNKAAGKSAPTKAVSEKPAAKPSTEKVSTAKPGAVAKPVAPPAAPAKTAATAKPSSEKQPPVKPAKAPAPATKSVKASGPASKPASGKTVAKKPEVAPKSAKKKVDAKAEASPPKKASAKKPAAKPEATEKKSEKKSAPPTKKSPPSEKAAAGSTNKKLTKQKPR